jgi:hypothetical protein
MEASQELASHVHNVAETKPSTPAFPRLNHLLQVANGSLLRTSPQRLPIHPSDDPTICYVHSRSRRASLLSTRHRPRHIDVHRSILPPARFGLGPLSEWLNTIGDGCVPDFQVASLDGIHRPPVQARFKTCGTEHDQQGLVPPHLRPILPPSSSRHY